MNITDIKKFFEDFIKKYYPYKYERVYNVLLDYISNNFFDNIYNNIPKELKSLFENNEIPQSEYDKILIAIGVSKNIILKMTLQDKLRFLFSMSEFKRYDGSLKFFRKISETFNENINIYELFINYSDELGWILQPYIIYSGFNNIVPNNMLYSDVYNKISSNLISIEQLYEFKFNGNLILPLKSNILLVEYNLALPVSDLYNLIVSSFLKSYGNFKFDLIVGNSIIETSINDFVIIWNYIFKNHYNIIYPNHHNFNLYHIRPEDAYDIKTMDSILSQFDSISNSHDYTSFFDNYISPIQTLYTQLNDIVIPIDFDINDDIFNSFRHSIYRFEAQLKDPLFSKYLKYLLFSLPEINKDPKETISYMFMYEYKPYEIELLISDTNIINITESSTPSVEYNFIFDMYYTDSIKIDDDFEVITNEL